MKWFVEGHLEGFVSRCRLFYEALTSESPSALVSNRPRSLPAGHSKQGVGEVEASPQKFQS
jgi:hypothetical protein